ncbi:MAG TPA: hypothetical protein DCW42_04210 [Bacteroidetes bacterium]|nr:hypothetical protein [Bacteroidota bacterium]
MGSSGYGRLTDYSEKSKLPKNPTGNEGGSDGNDVCDNSFRAILEDFERSQYFSDHKSTPPKDKDIYVVFEKRLSVKTLQENETIGYLPTQFNYLAACIKDGKNYIGKVVMVTQKPIVIVEVLIQPE